ncbi:YdeI/OmpD-associated family protein [Aspergillus undulatus]|uniref:YdeI/OmpD-associated family protein n=1 Tax=Aspergillus undulatus TaxID=1810928 RepID=UPI003CCD2894
MPRKIVKTTNPTTSTKSSSPKIDPPDTSFPTHSFPDIPSFECFLSTNHATLPGLYLKLAKKSSGIPSITAPQAVEVALCFGWIDGRANSLDENFWTVRYTPRRAKSLWSAKNVKTVERLIAEGRMRDAGMEAVKLAKGDGRWDRAYDGPAGIKVPVDLEGALEGDSEARRVWEGLNKSERWTVLHRLQTGARDGEKRREAIEGVVGMLRRGGIPSKKGKTAGDNKTSFRVEKKTVMNKGEVIRESK